MTSDKTKVLLPCPFCGGNEISSGEVLGEKFDKTRFTRTACLSCGAESGDGYSDTDADSKWNTRSAFEQPEPIREMKVQEVAKFLYKSQHYSTVHDSELAAKALAKLGTIRVKE